MVARRVYLDNVRAMRAANGNEMFVDADGWESVWNGLGKVCITPEQIRYRSA